MFSKTVLFAFACLAASSVALPIRREVPQEHSHEKFLTSVRASLNLDNPDKIQDPVFGLLGNAAATTGKGNIADPDCLQTATADRAFTNAKKAGDVAGMVAALQYRAIERNTGSVGLKSVLCTSFKPVNPEIAALTQHQDPASDGAAATNKAIVLELAKQIASVGGDPLLALETGTFAPGKIGDPTAKGNSCDDANDPVGCIFTQKLLVEDATADEIKAAVAGVSAGSSGSATAATNAADAATTTAAAATDSTATCAAPKTVTVTVSGAAATAAAANTAVAATTVAAATTTAAAASATSAAAASGDNLQTFTGALGGISAPAVRKGGRGFAVDNNADFLNLAAALGRSCDVQHNQCANAANTKSSADLTSVSQCDQQNNDCRAAISA